MVKIVANLKEQKTYRTVKDVPTGSVFSTDDCLYMKCSGRSECECNVVELHGGQLESLHEGTEIDTVYLDAQLVLGTGTKGE